jgi:hypothetical membrane protein
MKRKHLIVEFDNRKVTGFLIFVGSVQCILGIIVAEALYPGYSTNQNYISNLGVGPSSIIFNSSMITLGALGVVATYFAHQALKRRVFTFLLMMGSVGAIGVGVFPENMGVVHTAFSLAVFLFTGLAALWSYRVEEPPFSHSYMILGGVALLALALFSVDIHLGLGRGGMERLIAYPELLWAMSFGSRLSARTLKPK